MTFLSIIFLMLPDLPPRFPGVTGKE